MKLESSKMQDYEAAVEFLGTFGPFQKRVLFLLCLSTVSSGYNILSVIFLLATPPHHCYVPAHSNLSQEWLQAIIPVQVRTTRKWIQAYSSKTIMMSLISCKEYECMGQLRLQSIIIFD